MKFTAFILATAATTASAQFFGGFNPYAYAVQRPAYPFQQGGYPFQQPAAAAAPVYPFVNSQVVDPLAWERDCTWINSIAFRAALSRATCGVDVCVQKAPNGNGGGHKRPSVTVASADGYHVWGTVLNRAGRVCAIAYTGQDLSQQFPYGRILSAKLANTANSLSIPSRAMPSHVRHAYPANHRGLIMNGAGNRNYFGVLTERFHFAPDVWPRRASNGGAIQDGGANVATTQNLDTYQQPLDLELSDLWYSENSWWGFTLPAEQLNPGNVDVHYQGAASNYGEACGTNRQDPLCMQKPGGFAYQAGGLPLYDAQGVLRGALGVAGDNDCANHAIAWKAREQINMNYTPVSELRNFPMTTEATRTGTQAAVFLTVNAAKNNLQTAGAAPYLSDIRTDCRAIRNNIKYECMFHIPFRGQNNDPYDEDRSAAGIAAAPGANYNPAPVLNHVLHTYGGTLAAQTTAAIARVANAANGFQQNGNRAFVNTFFDEVHNTLGRIVNDGTATTAAAYRAGRRHSNVNWAGKKAEDNVIFDDKEQQLFPQCQAIIENFDTTNPTQSSIFSTAK